MAVAVSVYIPVAKMVERSGKKKPFIAATFGFFSAFPLVLLFSKTLSALAVAFVVRGLKEFGEPTRKALILDLSPENGRAGTYGAYYFVRDAVVALAAFGGGLLWEVSPRANLLTAFAFGVLGTAYFLLRCEE
jgi:MFS family permease